MIQISQEVIVQNGEKEFQTYIQNSPKKKTN